MKVMLHKSINHKPFFLVIAVLGLLALSCIWRSGENYDITKTSPNGRYRVRIEIRAEKGRNTSRGYIEAGKYLFFKDQEIIHTYEWRNPYQYEPTFRESMPIVEWVDNTVLRLGEDRSDQPFYDHLLVSNNTDDYLKYLDVNYGKHESFWIFDLAPRTQVTLQASPRFKPDHSSNYSLGYGGVTAGGKEFEGTIESKLRTTPADGPLKMQIVINPDALR